MIEQFLAFVVVPLVCYLFGQWVGIRSERATWINASFDAPDDHVHSRGHDYTVMLTNKFYRDYFNPLAGLRFAETRRLSPTDGAPADTGKVRTPK